jgi:hypothetical protein
VASKKPEPGTAQEIENGTWEDMFGPSAAPRSPAPARTESGRLADAEGFTSAGQRDAYRRVRRGR